MPPQQPQQTSSSKKTIVIITVALTVVILVSAVVFIGLTRSDNQDTELANDTPEPESESDEVEVISTDELMTVFEEHSALFSFNADTVSSAIRIIPTTGGSEGESPSDDFFLNKFFYQPSTPQTCRYHRTSYSDTTRATVESSPDTIWGWEDYDPDSLLRMAGVMTHMLSENCGDWTGVAINAAN